MAFDRTSWTEQRLRWERFEAWELERTRASQPRFEEALNWMSEAWDLARRWNPHWGTSQGAEDHCRYLVEIQRRLARGLRNR